MSDKQTPDGPSAGSSASAEADAAAKRAEADDAEILAETTPKSGAEDAAAALADEGEADGPHRDQGAMIYGLVGALVGGVVVLLGGALFGGDDGPAQTNYGPRLAQIEGQLATLSETGGADAISTNANAVAAMDRADAVDQRLTSVAEALAAQVEEMSAEIERIDGGVQTLRASIDEAAAAGGGPAAALTAELRGRIDALEAQAVEIETEIAGLRQADETLRLDVEQVADAASEIEASASVAPQIEAALRQMETALVGDIDEIKTQVAEETERLNSHAGRIDALEGRMTLQEQAAGPELGVAIAALSIDVDAGRSFAAALALVEAESDAPIPAALAAAQDDGVEGASELAARYGAASRAALRAIRRGEAADGDAFDRLGGLIVHRRRGETTGDSPDAALNRALAHVNVGDFAAALAEIDAMPEPALSYALRAPEMASWVEDARARVETEAALETYRAAVLTGVTE